MRLSAIIKICAILTVLLALLIIYPISTKAAAELEKPTLTIVNPLRGPQLGLEKANLLESLQGQWQATREASVSATWLWQYSAMENEELVSYAKENLKNQEFGIFLEIDKNAAEKAGVDHKGKGPWYYSDGLFLISYDIFERHKLIDTAFEKFKQTFGYYPTSVGAWWVGAQPIAYMKEKYAITAVLHCADQFNTDAYAIWGTPWSIPYIPSKQNAAVPAREENDSAGVVIMQWAPRDPLRAYGKDVKDSTFSLQDYQMKGYDIRYFNYLRNTFAKKQNDQLVFGLEGGLPSEAYAGQYRIQNLEAQKLQNQGEITIKTMRDAATKFINAGITFQPTHTILAKDYETDNQSFWFHSKYYRLGVIKKEDKIIIVDMRDYAAADQEDFYTVPNVETLLRINTPAIIDSIRYPKSEKVIATSKDPLVLKKEKDAVSLYTGSKKILTATENEVHIPDSNFIFTTNAQSRMWENTQTYLLGLHTNILLRGEIIAHSAVRYINEQMQSKKALAMLLFNIFLVAGYTTTIIMLIQIKQRLLALLLIIPSLIICMIQIKKITGEAERIIVTPAEITAIREIKNQKKNIVYIAPTSEKTFRAVRPLVYVNPRYIEKLAGVKVRTVPSNTDDVNALRIRADELLVISPYIGATIPDHEINKLNVVKIFDNAQIAIYKQK